MLMRCSHTNNVLHTRPSVASHAHARRSRTTRHRKRHSLPDRLHDRSRRRRIMLAPTPCLEPGCHEHAINHGRCQQHQRYWQGSRRNKRLPPDWSTRRLIVLKRDKGICYICGEPGADTVDHIQPGDNHELSNLAAVHDRTPPHCHRYKSAVEGHTTQQGNKTKRRL